MNYASVGRQITPSAPGGYTVTGQWTSQEPPPTTRQYMPGIDYTHGNSNGVGTVPSVVENSSTAPSQHTAQEQAPAAPPPNLGGLNWQSITLPTGDTGYTASAGNGEFFYYGPDKKLYEDPYSGEVHAGDLGNYVGKTADQYFSGASSASGSQPGDTSGSGSTSTTTPASDNPVNQILGGSPGNDGSAYDNAPPSVAGLQAIQPTQGATSSSGGSMLVIVIGIIIVAGIGYYIYKHHRKGNSQ